MVTKEMVKFGVSAAPGIPEVVKKDTTTAGILRKVSEYCEVDVNDIVKKTRKRYIVEPRQVAMYLAKRDTMESLSFIGWRLGGKDHATVIHAAKTVKNLLETNASFRKKWGGLIDPKPEESFDEDYQI